MTVFERLQNDTLPKVGTNEKGENVIVEYGYNSNGRYVRTATAQQNGWLRINYYYEDGTKEEFFDK